MQLYVEITERMGVKYINTKAQHSITQILTLLPAWGFLNTKIGGRKPFLREHSPHLGGDPLYHL